VIHILEPFSNVKILKEQIKQLNVGEPVHPQELVQLKVVNRPRKPQLTISIVEPF